MCGGHGVPKKAGSTCNPLVPDPTEDLVAQNLPDGYWLEAFYFHVDDKYPDLIGYGLGFEDKPATITHFINPKNLDGNKNGEDWIPIHIQTMDFPVSMTYGDLSGDGYNDIVICDRYGPSMSNLWDAETDNGGRVQWLKNPRNRFFRKNWEAEHIGNSTGMHRLKLGHFTTRDVLQVLAIPIIPKSSDLTDPAPVIIYTPEYDEANEKGSPCRWKKNVPFSTEFRLIHEIKVIPGKTPALDTALVAGREGIVYLHYSVGKGHGKWHYNVVGQGLPEQKGDPYWGSGSVDVCAVGDDPVGYIASCEAFHGNTISVYVKHPGAPKGIASLLKSSYWKRITIDDFGPLNEENTGTVHNVVAGDFDGNGVDGFGIACMGSPIGKPENQGVYVYRPTNLKEGKFHKSKVTNRSAGRLAVARFSNEHLDIASISYFVPGYLTGPDCPSIRVNLNTFFSPLSSTDIRVRRLDKEVLLLLPRPTDVFSESSSIPLINVAGRRLHIAVLPPHGAVKYDPLDAVKVMFGEIVMKDKDGQEVTRALAPERHQAATTEVVSPDGVIKAGANGAVIFRMERLSDHFQGPYRTMSELPITNVFPNSVPLDVQALQFPFIKVELLPWAQNGNWDDFEFYNMTGFHVHFGDDAFDRICHVQLWTLGLGETARFHIHNTIPFCEIHCCIANGGGTAGMRWFPDVVDQIDTKAELTKEYVDQNTSQVVVPALHEHGPLWKVQDGFRAKPKLLSNGCADYPWHAWLASKFGDWTIPITPPLPASEQSFDVWLAFEFPLSSFQY